MSVAKASHSHKTWTEVPLCVLHLLRKGLSIISIRYGCLLRVLRPVRRPVTTLVTYLRACYTYIHAYIHTCTRTYIHTYVHSYIHTYVRMYTVEQVIKYIIRIKSVQSQTVNRLRGLSDLHAWNQFQGSQCAILGWQGDVGIAFVPVNCHSIHVAFSCITGGCYSMRICGCITKSLL
jgi:hypothetical protein